MGSYGACGADCAGGTNTTACRACVGMACNPYTMYCPTEGVQFSAVCQL